MNGNAIEVCIQKIKSYISRADKYALPYFVNVKCQEDYAILQDKLGQIIDFKVNTSAYCRNKDAVPDIDKLYSELKNSHTNVLLVGFTEYLRLRGKEQLKTRLSMLKNISSENLRLVVITYQCEKELNEFISLDIRMRERIDLIDSIIAEKSHFTFVNIDSLNEKQLNETIQGFQDFLLKNENNQLTNAIINTKVNPTLFLNSLISINIVSNAFETLTFLSEFCANRFIIDMGTDEQWKYLLSKFLEYKCFKKILENEFSTSENLSIIFHKWTCLNSEQKWLYWLTLHTEVDDSSSYLKIAAKKATSVDSLVSNIYLAILDEDCFSERFKSLYNERKLLIKDISSVKDENDFCILSNAKEKNKIYYLTNVGEIEKKEIIKCLSNYKYERFEIDSILANICPALAKYLTSFHSDILIIEEYFSSYKYNKITNCITDDFLKLVKDNACNREFNVLPTRIEKFEKIPKENSEIYFVDSLGVEFLGYILNKSNELGMHADVTICRANLPTITSCNKDFTIGISDQIFYHDIKDLDELKHSGEGDYDYRKNKYPMHIFKELEIIDNVLNHALTKLNDRDKAIIVSDHGASRLVVINEQQYDFDVNSKGTHGGRCCEYTENIQEIEYATEENGYYVLASYDRFKGGRKASVETHGGATLEEVIIPIIELTLKKNNIIVNIKNKEVTTGRNIKPVLELISNCKLKNPLLKIDGRYFKSDKSDGFIYSFTLNGIKKSKTYIAKVFDSNNYIGDIEFVLKKASFTENDLL